MAYGRLQPSFFRAPRLIVQLFLIFRALQSFSMNRTRS
jgi:hypothetical protein